jgi:alpha-glucoside transport system permease protein
VEARPIMQQGRWTPWIYLAPAIIILGIFVFYPTVRTFFFSFQNSNASALATQNCVKGKTCWGILENYHEILTSEEGLIALRNTALWIIVMVPGTVFFGLLLAMLTNSVRYEAIAKSIIFMPMAISFVGAAIIWRFVYHPNEDIGLLNAIVTALGGKAEAWLALQPPLNTLMLTVIGLWIWTGFSMTILAAAIRNVPDEQIECARVDGATEFTVFRRIILPTIMPTIAVVMTVMTINTLKMFDIVWVMKGVKTDILATEVVKELYLFRNSGLAAAYAMILIALIIPMTVYNIRRFTAEEARK